MPAGSHRLLRLELRRLARPALPRGARQGSLAARYAEEFDTVEVNSTFYRLASRDAVARWVEETPDDFLFAAKASRYLTHVRRLQDIEQGIERYYERIEPLVARRSSARRLAAARELQGG